MKKTCIVNAYVGQGWFREGQKRLEQSLKDHSIDVDFFAWGSDIIDSEYYAVDCPYTVKASAIDACIKRGYERIIWLDCSVTVLKPLDEWLKIIDRDGYYFMAGGWNCAQECNDKSLEYFGYNRDEAELLPCLWSCIFAFDLTNPQAKAVCDLFLQSCLDGVFHGSRHHDNQSKDKRFLHHRQDQSALSLAYHKVGLDKLYSPNIHMYYAGFNNKQLDTNIFKVQGGI
jgi:hypothetical protein